MLCSQCRTRICYFKIGVEGKYVNVVPGTVYTFGTVRILKKSYWQMGPVGAPFTSLFLVAHPLVVSWGSDINGHA